MKEVKLKSMHIERFKGLASLDVDFGSTTAISGRNALGKTCVYDAYLWCLFNKDSRGRIIDKVQFMKNGVADKDARTIVSVLFSIDGVGTEFRRELYQSWSKKRGTTEYVYNGDASDYFFNNVPLALKEYDEKIKSLFDKDKFELVSNINLFASLATQERRTILEQIADVSSLTKLIAEDYPDVAAAMAAGKSIDEFTVELRKKLSKVATDEEQIPVRIDEIKRSIPADVPDFNALKEKKAGLQKQIEEHEAKIAEYRKMAVTGSNAELNKQLDDVVAKISSLTRAASIEFSKERNAEQDTLNDLKLEVTRAEKKAKSLEEDLALSVSKTKAAMARFDAAKVAWTKENERQYEPNTITSCPTCGHVFTPEEIAEKEDFAIEVFNKDKLDRLAAYEREAANAKADVDAKRKEGLDVQAEYDKALEAKREAVLRYDDACKKPSSVLSIEDRLKDNKEYAELSSQRDRLQADIDSASPRTFDIEIAAEKKAQTDLACLVGSINVDLAKEVQIANANARLAELEKESRDLGEERARIEQQLDEIQAFQHRKMTSIEDRINSLFQYVKIKMFKPNKTNDGVMDACDIVVDDIPFSVLNTASRINAGIDICCTLATAYGIKTPIWVDNAESVNKFIWSDCQLITLRVSEENNLTVTQK